MKTALITGVMGQVGSHMADFLLERDYKVVGLKRRSASGSNWRLKNALLNKNFSLVEGELTDFTSVAGIVNFVKPDEIYNFAAQSHVGTSFEQTSHTFDVNTIGVLNILNSIKFIGLNNKTRIYQSSTSEMFGSSWDWVKNHGEKYLNFPLFEGQKDYGPINGHKGQNENTKFDPQSPYAVSKLAAHNLVKIYREAYGIWAVGGIMFNTEGPRRHINFVTRKITNYFTKLKSKRDDKLKLGNLDAFRDWSYAKEAVEAIWLMTNNTSPKEYVIGTGETHSVKEFLNEVYNYYGFDTYSPLEHFVEIDDNFKRPLEVPYLCADPTAIQRDLGWVAKTKFKDLVRIMCEEENGKE